MSANSKWVGVAAALVLTGAQVFAACGTCEGKAKCQPPHAGCPQDKAACSSAAAGEAGLAEIDTPALKAMLDAKAAAVVLDARTGKYDDGRRIPGAKALSPTASAEEAAAAIAAKDALVVTYCSNLKCPASRMLAKRLKELGYTNIIEYPHGIEGWAAAGYPVENVKN